MAILSLKLDQLFILLVPAFVEGVVGAGSFPSEPDFVQKLCSIKWKFVIVMKPPLLTNPAPERPVLLVTPWHITMAIVSFKLDQLFKLRIPFLI
jgi:hypothetical protein